jgi:hypothetical protein
MRKLVWGCFTAALAVLGFSLWAFDYATGHPDSWLGRCCYGAHHVAVAEVKTAQATRRTAQVVLSGMQGLMGQAAGAVCGHDQPCPAHAEAAGEECNLEPAVLPGAVVMPEDEEMPAAQPLPPVHDLVGGQPWHGGAEECEEAPMPRAEEEAVKMPLVEEEFGVSCGPQPPASMHGPCPHADHDAVHKEIKGRDFQSGSEECEPLMPKVRPDGGEAPRHPDVDTMEVRPGDLRFRDFTGPF